MSSHSTTRATHARSATILWCHCLCHVVRHTLPTPALVQELGNPLQQRVAAHQNLPAALKDITELLHRLQKTVNQKGAWSTVHFWPQRPGALLIRFA